MDSPAVSSLADTLRLFQNLNTRYEVYVSGIKEQENLQQDLLHKLELEPLNAVELVRTAKQLKECRETRRLMKDELERLTPIVEFIQDKNNAKTINQLSELMGRLRKIDTNQANRRYYPRVL